MAEKWYEKKVVYIPLAIVLGLFGFDIIYGSLYPKNSEEEFNPDYYTKKDAPLFISKKSSK